MSDKKIIQKRTFTKKDITALTGLKPNQVKYFVEQGLIADVEVSSGTGHYRTFTVENLCEFAILEVLNRYGFSARDMENILRLIKSSHSMNEPDAPPEEWEFLSLEEISRIKEFEHIVHLYKRSKDDSFFCVMYLGFRDKYGNMIVGNESFQFSGDSCILVNVTIILRDVLKQVT